MKFRTLCIIASFLLAAGLLSGCGSSEETEKDKENATPPPAEVMKKAPADLKTAQPLDNQKTETKTEVPAPVKEAVQKDVPPPTSNTEVKTTVPSGKFSVQIGSFDVPKNAESAASLARTRLEKRVYIMRDEASNRLRVLVGDFTSKDEARTFRDHIAQQFPEYQPAWVFDTANR